MTGCKLLFLLLAAVGIALTSCSLLIDFNPEGKPCGGVERACLPGYHCNSELVCVKGDGPPDTIDDPVNPTAPETDAGAAPETDAGAAG